MLVYIHALFKYTGRKKVSYNTRVAQDPVCVGVILVDIYKKR